MSSSQQNVINDQQPVSTIDLTEPRNARRIELGSSLIALFFIMVLGVLLSTSGHSPYWMLIVVVLLIPGILLHEICHYIFQWVFSGLKPRLGFKFPFPYSALAPNARITRNQGIFSALAPFLFVTPLLVLPSLFISFLPKIIFLAWASVEAATCFGDFFLIHWLLRHPKQLKLGNVGLSNALFRDT
jgi:hypothetical protein